MCGRCRNCHEPYISTHACDIHTKCTLALYIFKVFFFSSVIINFHFDFVFQLTNFASDFKPSTSRVKYTNLPANTYSEYNFELFLGQPFHMLPFTSHFAYLNRHPRQRFNSFMHRLWEVYRCERKLYSLFNSYQSMCNKNLKKFNNFDSFNGIVKICLIRKKKRRNVKNINLYFVKNLLADLAAYRIFSHTGPHFVHHNIWIQFVFFWNF